MFFISRLVLLFFFTNTFMFAAATPTADSTASYDKNAFPEGGIQSLMNKIVYPQRAKEEGKEGLVVVTVLVDEDGTPETIEVKERIGFGFDESAIAAVSGTKFIPAEKSGKKVSQLVTLPVRFKLDGQPQDKNKKTEQDGDVYKEADKMPFPVNGVAQLAKNIVYPEEAKKLKIEGKVIVGAVIDADGNATQVKVIKNVHPLLDAAAIEAVKKTKFTPGEKNGKKVKVSIAMPISFKLE